MSCECSNWASVDHVHRVLTGHHERCPHSPAPLGAALELIAELTRAVELWGAEEDGIHPEAWEAYRRGKALQGVFIADGQIQMASTPPATAGWGKANVVRHGPCEHLLYCDFCCKSETVDCYEMGELRPMYRLDDDCIICQRCLDAGQHTTPTAAQAGREEANTGADRT